MSAGNPTDDAADFVLDLDNWDGTVPEDWAAKEAQLRHEEWDATRKAADTADAANASSTPAVQPEPPTARLTPGKVSTWDDIELDSILDAVVAGTFTLPMPTVGMLADGSCGLLYPGRVNGIAGESGAGKGWIALAIAAQHMRLGWHLFYIDFEDSPALVVLRLVKVLGVDPELVRSQLHYIHPANHSEFEIDNLVARVSLLPNSFVVIDSTGESIAAAGLNQNADEDVARWMQSLAHPLADQGGACVVLLDHMVKSEDGGLWPIGSQRKRAAITGAQYVAEVARPFSKNTEGMVVLKVAKDRHGAREARSVATYIQFRHPTLSSTTAPDGSLNIVFSEQLDVIFGLGKTAQQAAADKAARDAAALAADVAEINKMLPAPTGYAQVKAKFRWADKRAQDAMRAWKAGRKP